VTPPAPSPHTPGRVANANRTGPSPERATRSASARASALASGAAGWRVGGTRGRRARGGRGGEGQQAAAGAPAGQAVCAAHWATTDSR
jgi:hypothetical protein